MGFCRLILAAACGLLACSCQTVGFTNYDLVKGEGDIVYRINRGSGQVVGIVGTSVTEVVMPEDWGKGRETAYRQWADQTVFLADNQSLTLRMNTLWRDGKLRYVVIMTPQEAVLRLLNSRESKNSTISPHFVDRNGFSLISRTINLKDFSQVVDKDRPVHFQYEGSLDCSLKTYLDVSAIYFGWSL